MHDDSQDPEYPARADVSSTNYPPADGRCAWIDLTGFQRDCLEAVARCERDGVVPDERAITDTLERAYPGVDRTRLEFNLRPLVGLGLLEERRLEARGDAYPLTDAGRALLIQRAERFADACGIAAFDSETGGAGARGDGEG
ncbi:PadR family transcriptional regulator [Natrinema sp. 1APR25-10V2]|uniref:PadR family transcriptional regulator n=1 Tax=Natrinema sp. 1APR25-10V2 TaxID=2951081 RepID=UPI0028769060|nr:PadR family transcriptional regulator [Natrinema sp. 1APR25-10V2]MDS0477930.1 PadR family transcriptional regulator [Natrinema sp. 1APR25-10V2]